MSDQQRLHAAAGGDGENLRRQGRRLPRRQQQLQRHAAAHRRPCEEIRPALPRAARPGQRRRRPVRRQTHAGSVPPRRIAERRLPGPHRRPVRRRLPARGADPARSGRGHRRGAGRQAGVAAVHDGGRLFHRAGRQAEGRREHHVQQGRVAHAATELPGVSPARSGRADAALDLRGRRRLVRHASAKWCEQKRMPPWLADPHFGKFQNDRSLADADRGDAARLDRPGLSQGRRRRPAAGKGVRGRLVHRQARRGVHHGGRVHGPGRRRPQRSEVSVLHRGNPLRRGPLDSGRGGQAGQPGRGASHHRLRRQAQPRRAGAREDRRRHRRRLPDRLRPRRAGDRAGPRHGQASAEGRHPRLPDALHAQRRRAEGSVVGRP